MGLIYLAYVLFLSCATLAYCRRYAQPAWWAVVALVFPPALPVFVVKVNKGKPYAIAVLSMLLLIMVVAGEAYLHGNRSGQEPVAALPPIIKKVISINETVKTSTIQLYEMSKRLDSISMVQSRITDIRNLVEIIQELRTQVDKNHQHIDALLTFINEHETYLQNQNLAWIFVIRDFYSDDIIHHHQQSRTQYLNAFERMLIYMHDNFENIMEVKNQVHLKNYEAYYMIYRRAADNHNRYNRKRLLFQNQFVQSNPEVKPLLPGSHHLEPFKFWDRFSF